MSTVSAVSPLTFFMPNLAITEVSPAKTMVISANDLSVPFGEVAIALAHFFCQPK